MIEAISTELILRKEYLNFGSLDTIYFGGGTPSILFADELEGLVKNIHSIFDVSNQAEITLEANPDDLSEEKLSVIKSLGVNRLSIGVQSFQDNTLKMLNRAHNSDEAINSIELARKVGFDNLSIDLIFSIPGHSIAELKKDIDQVILMNPEHISVYSLTIEEKTVFGNWQKKGRFKAVDDELSATQFDLLISELELHNFEQYEISNFCRDGNYARHNTAYWKDIHYIGIGPGAHSYNGSTRQYNIANNHKYMKSIAVGNVPFELDNLSHDAQVNEYLLTSLRTKWGCDLSLLKRKYGYDLLRNQKEKISQLIRDEYLIMKTEKLLLTRKGKFLADDIISDLFWIP